MSILGNAIMVGGQATPASPQWKDVNFIDYDGTLLYSYTASEFQALTAMPANPTHSGLTSQGWNWSLADAKTQVTATGKCDIGQMYITTDGKTRVYIHLEEGRLEPYCGLGINGTATIDWGDGSSEGTLTGTSESRLLSIKHTYANAGDYVITININGSAQIQQYGSGSGLIYAESLGASAKVYRNTIQKVEIGNNVTGLSSSAFSYCFALTSITIPDSVTSIGSSAFYNCYTLTSITIPDSVTSIGNSTFQYCFALTSITIPDSVTSIGNTAFYNCYTLTSITVPGSVTSIGTSAFSYCGALTSITAPSGVTSIGNSAFQYCYTLTSITIPGSVTSIGTSTFASCYTLTRTTIPDGVTSIGQSAFQYCYTLTSVTIPDSVTSIGSSAFYNCYDLGFIRFKSSTPPTVSNSNAWTNIPADCIIYVPTGSLSAYTTATNYPSSSTYTYVEY